MNKTTATQQASTSTFTPSSGNLLQRKCACGNHTMAGGECIECAKKKTALQRKLTIGASNDPLELEADRVADQVVAKKAAPLPVSSLTSGQLQRQEMPKEKTNEEKFQEGLEKLGEAFLETPVGKQLLEKIKQDKLIKGSTELGKEFISTWPGKIITGTAATGAVAALAATHKELPAQIPEIPLDGLIPGLSVKLTYKGPVDKPTEAMITLKFTEQAPKGDADKKTISESDKNRAEADRMAADQDKFQAGLRYPPGSQEDLQQKAQQEAIRKVVQKYSGGPNIEAAIKKYPWLTTPQQPKNDLQLTMPKPSFGVQPPSLLGDEFKLKSPDEQKKKLDELPLQRKLSIGASNDPLEQEADRVADQVMAAPQHSAVNATAPHIQRFTGHASEGANAAPDSVDRVLSGSGRPLEPALRQDMEQRFGHDFSQVRVHTGSVAEQSARDVNANAYTAGRNIVFGAGRFSPGTYEGRRLIAHELTHVVQQSGTKSIGAGQNNAQEDLTSNSYSLSLQRKVVVGELPLPGKVDFNALADQVFEAIEGLGTDEEAVYRALQQLRRDPSMIDTLIGRYAQRHDGADMIADINDDFSGTELEYALQLLGRGHGMTTQEIAVGPEATTNLERAAKRLREAVEGFGTDEEAIYATLLPFNRSTQDLEQTYNFLYGETLRWRINDEMSGEELKYALSLLSFDKESFLTEHFEKSDRPFSRKILNDIFAIKGDQLDFADDSELAVEISKRMRTSQLMQESQMVDAFDYPESCTQDTCPSVCIGKGQQGEAGYVPPNINFNAHVNKDARDYWMRGADEGGFYMFNLTHEGWGNPFRALVKLFNSQSSICDKTLIHCDYLTTVIHLRAFAESIGPDVFNQRVRSGEIAMNLSYWGFGDVMMPTPPGSREVGRARKPGAVSLQAVQPASEDDLLIGDHVIFWNHLAYDALTFSPFWFGPWRLENALLVDQDDSGNNLYEGHGAPLNPQQQVVKGDKKTMLKDIVNAYNGPVKAAQRLTKSVDNNEAGAENLLRQEFPRVVRDPTGAWWIAERDDRDENRRRPKRFYELRPLADENDPDLIGLRDPDNPSKMGWVKRPIESAPGRSPSAPKD